MTSFLIIDRVPQFDEGFYHILAGKDGEFAVIYRRLQMFPSHPDDDRGEYHRGQVR